MSKLSGYNLRTQMKYRHVCILGFLHIINRNVHRHIRQLGKSSSGVTREADDRVSPIFEIFSYTKNVF